MSRHKNRILFALGVVLGVAAMYLVGRTEQNTAATEARRDFSSCGAGSLECQLTTDPNEVLVTLSFTEDLDAHYTPIFGRSIVPIIWLEFDSRFEEVNRKVIKAEIPDTFRIQGLGDLQFRYPGSISSETQYILFQLGDPQITLLRSIDFPIAELKGDEK